MSIIWKNDNKIWNGNSIIYNNYRYFNPTDAILSAAGFTKKIINDEPVMTQEQQLKQYEDAVQAHLDATAQSKRI